MSERIAIFPGSFDPITKGHEAVIKRALPLFDRIIVAIGINTNKVSMFTQQQRMDWIKSVFENEKKVEVVVYEGLTIDLYKKYNAQFLLRGLRNTIDFEYEKSIASMNRTLDANIETVLLFTDDEHAGVNSSIVREIIKNKGDVTTFLPDKVKFSYK